MKKRQKKPVDVEAVRKRANLNRLRRIEGQVRGVEKMIEDDRYCPDIMVQVASVQQALRALSSSLMSNHLRHCAVDAFKKKRTRDQMCDELVKLIYKHSR